MARSDPRPEREDTGERSADWEALLQRGNGRRRLIGEVALVCAWVLVNEAVYLAATGGGRHHSVTSITLAWTVTAASGVLLAGALSFRRVAEHRVRQGLRDAGDALHSIEAVTEPALSFLAPDDLLEELLGRITTAVGADLAAVLLASADGDRLTLRAAVGLPEPASGGDADGTVDVPFGRGIVGAVAERRQAVVVNGVPDAARAAPPLSGALASLMAAPLLVGDTVLGVVLAGMRRRQHFRARDLRLLQLVADRAAALERARLDDAERRSRLGAEHARLHLSLLARTGEVLAGALESYDRPLEQLGAVIVPQFADWFAVDLIGADGRLQRLVHGDGGPPPPRSGVADATRGGTSPPHRHPDGDRLVAQVMASGRPHVLIAVPPGHRTEAWAAELAIDPWAPDSGSDRHQEVAQLEGALAAGIESMLVVPVHVRGLSFGALSFVTSPGRRGYRRSDLETAVGIAERVAVAVERVLLWRETRQAERAATMHAAQLRRLMEAALAVNAPLSEDQVLDVVSAHARRVLAADLAVVVSFPDEPALSTEPGRPSPGAGHDGQAPAQAGGAHRHARVEARAPRSVGEQDTEAAVAAGRLAVVSGRSLRAGEGRIEGLPGGGAPAGSELSALGYRSWMAAPVHDAGALADATRRARAHGDGRAVVVLGPPDRPFGPEEESVLVLLAQMTSVALDNARLYQAVAGSEQRLRALVESSPLAIAELDLSGRVRWCNRAADELLGWALPRGDAGTDGEHSGWRRIAGRDPAADDVLADLWRRARQGEQCVGVDVAVCRAGGEVRELSVSTAPLRDPGGAVTGILAVLEDVTERRRLLDRFHQTQRLGAMARLAGGVAHDFNNLLTVILGSSEILARALPAGTPMAEEVAAIQRAGQRAAELTARLLAVGQRRPVQAAVVDPADVVAAMSSVLGRVVGDDVVLELRAEQPRGCILIDPAELERVLVNLTINARDAMADGGSLEITTTSDGDDVCIVVRDSGCGMDATTLEHCFEPFFTTKARAEGTGLGLAAVHAAVTQAGGRIEVESAPGCGTTFTLRFPAVLPGTGSPEVGPGEAAVAGVAAQTTAVPGAAASGLADRVGATRRRSRSGPGAAGSGAERPPGRRPLELVGPPAPTGRPEEVVLVVEDEPELRRLAALVLVRRGYTVVAAADAVEALTAAERMVRPPAVLVTDVVMPGMHGVELARRLVSRWPGLPVLYVSGHFDEAEAPTAIAGERADLLPKPFTPDELARRVRLAIDRAAARAGAP